MPRAKATEEVEEVMELEEEEELEEEVIGDGLPEEVTEPTPVAGTMIVMDRETMEEVTIDPTVEKNWKKKYLHRSGNEFDHQY